MSNEAYEASQRERDEEYESAYKEWVASMSDEEKERLREMGLDHPQVDRQAGGGSECDLADSPVASYDPREDQERGESEGGNATQDESLWGVIRKCLEALRLAENRGFTLECLSIAAGIQSFIGRSNEIETAATVARKYEVSEIEADAEVIRLAELVGLQPATQILDKQTRFYWSIVRKLVGEMKYAKHPSLTLDAFCLVSGLEYEGDSLSGIGRKHGVTRAAVSKRCVSLCESMGLPPSRAMRSEAAREAYSDARLRSLKK